MLNRTVNALADLGIYAKTFINLETADEDTKQKAIQDKDGYYYIPDKHDMDIDEINIALKIRQLNEIKSIKHMIMFFVILTVLTIAILLFKSFIN